LSGFRIFRKYGNEAVKCRKQSGKNGKISVRFQPYRPVDRAGQADGYSSHTTNVPESLNDFSRPWSKNTPQKHNLHRKRTLHKAN
jgi:hypothetical protein